MNLKKQLSCVYASSFFAGLRITDAVWVALLAARGYSLWQIGLAEGVYHAVSLLCEVPSGMMADLLGRKRTLVCGGAFIISYNLLMVFAPNIFVVCLAMGLNALSNTMFSGTESALVYDSLKQADRESDYLSVSANSAQISMLATALGSLASLLEQRLGFAVFYLLSGGFESAATAARCCLTEPVVTEAQANRRPSLHTLPAQFVQLGKDSLAALRSCPLAVRIILADAVICVPTYLVKMFVQQRLIELGWQTAWLFVPMLLGGVAAALGTELGRHLRPAHRRQFFTLCALGCGTGALLAGLAPSAGALAGCALVQCTINIWVLHSERWLNDAIPSDQRATLISVDSMAYSVLMILASPAIGALGDLTGHAGAGLALLGGVVAVSGLLVWCKR